MKFFSAFMIISLRFAYCLEKGGVVLYIPSISVTTKICPSHDGPAPIPIVGVDIRVVIAFATSVVTYSIINAKIFTFSKAFASKTRSLALVRSLPCTLIPPKM